MAEPASSPMPDKQLGALLGVTLTLAALVVLGWAFWRGLAHPNRGPTRTHIGDAALAGERGEICGEHDLLTITLAHSPDKSAWLQQGVEGFMRRCPNVQIRLRPLSDFEAVEALVHREVEPALWIPTSTLFVDMLDDQFDYEISHDLLRSPLVVLAQSDRIEALEQLSEPGPTLFERDDVWAELACLLPPDVVLDEELELSDQQPWTWLEWWTSELFVSPAEPPGSPTIEQLREWGRVDFVHSSPSRDSSGLAALVLMSHGYLGSTTPEAFEQDLDSRREQLQAWLRRCEAGQDEPVVAGRVLAQRIHQLGPEGFDGVFTYEQRALEVLQQLSESEDDFATLRIITPSSTLVSDHPAVLFAGPETDAGIAARRVVEFLYEPAMQESAITQGFRPGNPDVDIRLARIESNPFIDLRRLGASLTLEVREPPELDRERLRELLDTWQDATGRQ